MRLSFSEITTMIRDKVKGYDPTATVILYGSRARGDARSDSDWDVVTIVNRDKVTEADKDIMSYELWAEGLRVGEEINNYIYTSAKWDASFSLFKYNVIREGIVL